MILCPHCGATKDRLREIGAVDHPERGPDKGFVFCNSCMTLMVWELGREQSVRRATAGENEMLLSTLQGQASFLNALLRHMATRR